MRRERYVPVLFAFLLSGQMSLLVSGIATFRAMGWGGGFIETWFGAWLPAWLIAFPSVLVAAPMTRRLSARLLGGGASTAA